MTKIELHQPSCEALVLLDQALAGQHPYSISYAEITVDCITASRSVAKALWRCLLAHLAAPAFSSPVKVVKRTTAYFARRKKKKINLALYWDKPSKHAGRHQGEACMHMEFRIPGAAKLAVIGLTTLRALAEFDHMRFWASRVALLTFPSKDAIAREVVEKRTASRATRYRGVQTYLNRLATKAGAYAAPLHNLLLKHPVLLNACRLIAIGYIWRKRRKDLC